MTTLVDGVRALRAENVALMRGYNVLFRELRFSLSAGETLSVEGPNGVGKTSLLRLIAGFLAPLEGCVLLEVEGGKTIEDAEGRGRFVGWLGDHDGIKPQLSPRENLAFFARPGSRTADIDSTLARVNLARVKDHPAQYLSAGQRRRLALGRLLTASRPLWLLDEPLAALDGAGRALVAEVIAEHARAGGITITATHETLGFPCRTLALQTA